jgi:type I restriction enzyme S subunit
MSQNILELFDDVAVCGRTATDIRKGAYRLDASFYSADNRAAIKTLEASGLTSTTLSTVAEIFCSGVRERTFVQSGKGYALITGSDLDTATDADIRYVSPIFTRNYSSERLVRGDILISSAGTVGKCDFVWKNHEDRLASQDIVRVRANKNEINAAYLYAVLSSPLGNAMLVNQSAGSVIIRIYTEHLKHFQVPRLSARLEDQITEKVIASFEHRSQSRELLCQAHKLIININKLDPIPEPSEEEPTCFDNISTALSSDEFRLEARFYNPIAKLALSRIRKSQSNKLTVGELAHDVIMGGRFKRNYVESAYGTPFLSGKSTIQIRPTDLKHLSNSETENLDDMLVKRGWILVTCSGTIGRTSFVWHNFEDYAASQHILRVLPDNDKVDPGYLYCFLASDYGYYQIHRFRHGSVIDEVTDQQLRKVVVPLPSPSKQREVGDLVRLAYEKRAKALMLEDEAQKILLSEFEGNNLKRK